MLVMIPMFLTFEFGDGLFRSPYLSGIVVAGVAALMVSRVPTFSFKRVHLPIEWWPPVLLLTVGLVAFMTTEPWATLLAVEALYIASIPLSIRSYRRLRRAAEALRSGVPHEEIEAADHPGL